MGVICSICKGMSKTVSGLKVLKVELLLFAKICHRQAAGLLLLND
jgi:hypothetical protein